MCFYMLIKRLSARGNVQPVIYYDDMYESAYSISRKFNIESFMVIKLLNIICITKNILNKKFNKPYDSTDVFLSIQKDNYIDNIQSYSLLFKCLELICQSSYIIAYEELKYTRVYTSIVYQVLNSLSLYDIIQSKYLCDAYVNLFALLYNGKLIKEKVNKNKPKERFKKSAKYLSDDLVFIY